MSELAVYGPYVPTRTYGVTTAVAPAATTDGNMLTRPEVR